MQKLALLFVFFGPFFLATPLMAQFNIPEGPQHAYYAGIGFGPTNKDISVAGGVAEKISGTKATYWYSGATIVPALITNANGSKSLSITTIGHTGFSQIVASWDRWLVSLDFGAGAALPSDRVPAFNFATVGAANIGFRLNKTHKTETGTSNSYLGIRPQFTQIRGDRADNVVSLGIGFVHATN